MANGESEVCRITIRFKRRSGITKGNTSKGRLFFALFISDKQKQIEPSPLPYIVSIIYCHRLNPG